MPSSLLALYHFILYTVLTTFVLLCLVMTTSICTFSVIVHRLLKSIEQAKEMHLPENLKFLRTSQE